MGKPNHGRSDWKEQPRQLVSLAKPALDSAGMRGRMHEQQQPSLPVGCMAPMSYWPADAMYVRGLQELILNQVHYYFSPENLVKARRHSVVEVGSRLSLVRPAAPWSGLVHVGSRPLALPLLQPLPVTCGRLGPGHAGCW